VILAILAPTLYQISKKGGFLAAATLISISGTLVNDEAAHHPVYA
jgi:hypothetical protein